MMATLRWILVGVLVATASGASQEEELLRAYMAVWSTGQIADLDELVTEDFERHAAVGAATSRADLERVVAETRSFYRDLQMKVFDVIAGEGRGALRSLFVGTYGETEFVIEAPAFNMFHFRDGKIAAEWVQGNTLNMWTSFGYRLSPPDATIVPPPIGPTQRPFPVATRISTAELAEAVTAARDSAPENAGTLSITTPVAARLELNGKDIGGLAAGGSVVLPVEPGRHVVGARSLGGSRYFESPVKVKRRRDTQITIEPPARAIVRPRERTTEDLQTGLMWQMMDNGVNISLPEAQAMCESLEQGGATDWRLPDIYELQSLYSEATTPHKRYHSIDGVRLSDCCAWTSTPHGDYHWTYVFSMGMRFLQVASLPWHMRALCVRDASGTALGP